MEGIIFIEIPIILPKGNNVPMGERGFIKTKATVNVAYISGFFPNEVVEGSEKFQVTCLPMAGVTYYVNMEYDAFSEWLKKKLAL